MNYKILESKCKTYANDLIFWPVCIKTLNCNNVAKDLKIINDEEGTKKNIDGFFFFLFLLDGNL